jgi:hypothetical protein
MISWDRSVIAAAPPSQQLLGPSFMDGWHPGNGDLIKLNPNSGPVCPACDIEYCAVRWAVLHLRIAYFGQPPARLPAGWAQAQASPVSRHLVDTPSPTTVPPSRLRNAARMAAGVSMACLRVVRGAFSAIADHHRRDAPTRKARSRAVA